MRDPGVPVIQRFIQSDDRRADVAGDARGGFVAELSAAVGHFAEPFLS